MSDLERYRRDQAEFFRRIEDEGRAADVARWVSDVKRRGGDPHAVRRFFDTYLSFLRKHRGLADAVAHERAVLGVATALEMDADQLRAILDRV
jgi:hypothetical protein